MAVTSRLRRRRKRRQPYSSSSGVGAMLSSSSSSSAAMMVPLFLLLLIPLLTTVSDAQSTFDIFPLKNDTVSFHFTYIFLIGGKCGDDVDWYSKWAKAGVETIQNVTEILCASKAEGYKDGYNRDFHINALEKVEQLVGDRLHETLVITVGIGLEEDWTPVANLIKRGMAFFHAKEDEHDFRIQDYGLKPETALYFYFQFNEEAAARNIGRELCRLHNGAQQLKVAKVYTAGRRNNSLNFRVDDALDVFRDECEETEIIQLWSVYDDIVTNNDTVGIETLLKFNRVPDLLLTARDKQASVFLDVAKQVLPPNKYNRIKTTGWNYVEEYRHLLEECKILATVDQEVLYPNRGLWEVIGDVVVLVEKFGLRTSKQVQEKLHLDAGTVVIKSDTTMITCDQVGFLLNKLLKGSYDPKAAPRIRVPVRAGLYDVSITQMTPFEGKFEANFWLRMEWKDPRLEWNKLTYDGQLPIDPEDIWTPKVYYNNQNDIEEAVLYQGPAMAESDGTVVLNTHSKIEFLCPTTSSLKAFPFDQYICSIQLGAPYGVTLDPDGIFEITREEPNFSTNQWISEVAPEEEKEEDKENHMGEEEIIYYMMHFQRKPFTAWVRIIIPGILINIVGFTSFWISEPEESVALGVTSLLCVLAFRETVDIPETSDINWTEVFLGINLWYQTMVMFIIFCSYGRFKGVAKFVDRMFRPFHPKSVKDQVLKSTRPSVETQERIRLATEIPENDMVDPRFSTSILPPESSRQLPSFSVTGHAHSPASAPGSERLSVSTFHNDTSHHRSNHNHIHPQQFTSSSSRSSSGGWNGTTTQLPRMEKLREDSAADSGTFEAQNRNNNNYRTLNDSVNQPPQVKFAVEGFSDEGESKLTTKNIISEEEDTVDHSFNVNDPNLQDTIQKSYRSYDKKNSSATSKKSTTEKFDQDGDKINVDWIGRIYIVPSYIIVMLTLVTTKWGLTSDLTQSQVS